MRRLLCLTLIFSLTVLIAGVCHSEVTAPLTKSEKVTMAQNLAKEGRYLEAAELHPLQWVKAWYYLNHARSFIGEKGADGKWVYSDEAMKDMERLQNFEKYVAMAANVNAQARLEGILGTGANGPDELDEYVNQYNGLVKKNRKR